VGSYYDRLGRIVGFQTCEYRYFIVTIRGQSLWLAK
jgi:hypothetical protein